MATPAGGVPCAVCPEHAGMVSRDRCDLTMDALEQRMHGKIADVRTLAEDNRRRLDTTVGTQGMNGKLGVVTARLAAVEDEQRESRRRRTQVALALVSATAGGTGLGYALIKLLLGGG